MIKDYIATIGMDIIKSKIIDVHELSQIENRLKRFIEQQEKINLHCTKEEELDFAGLTDYIRFNIPNEVKMLFFDDRESRESARKTIITKAVEYSQSHTTLSRKRAIYLVDSAIIILKNFYRLKINKSILLVASQIEDTIIEDNRIQLDKQTKQLINSIEQTSIMSVDKNIQLLKIKDFASVETNINAFFSSILSQHDLHPYYGYDFKNINGMTKLYSKPLSPEAMHKYPPQMEVVGTIRLGEKYVDRFSNEIIDYSNRHQIPITIDVHEARKLLGDKPDPIQYEADRLKGKAVRFYPPPFPNAFPCSVSLDGRVEFDYILLRTKEILDDDTIIITNSEQSDFPFKITISANLIKQSLSFRISINYSSNKDMLRYDYFIKKASSGAVLTITLLETGQKFSEGILGFPELTTGFSSLDEEIIFLEKVISIEEYFKTSILIPEIILQNDYETICYVSSLINNKKYVGYCYLNEFHIEVSEYFKIEIEKMIDSQYDLSSHVNVGLLIFEKPYNISIERIYKSVQIENLERLKEKARLGDIGDTIKVICVPGDYEDMISYVDILCD